MLFEPLPTQVEGAAFLAARKHALLADEPRVGKQQPVDCLVATPSGMRPIGSLKVGDIVCHPSGGTSVVEGVFPQGMQQAYRVTLSDGSSTECGGEHLWAVRDSNSKRRVAQGLPEWQVLPLSDIWYRKTTQYLPEHASVHFERREPLPIHPYLLGALIGDGSLCNGQALLSIAHRDLDILNRIKLICGDGWEFKSRTTGENCDQVRIGHYVNGANVLLRRLNDLGLSVKSGLKFIPDFYLTANEGDRRELLRGLMDTDGHCGLSGSASPIGIRRIHGATSFSSSSKKLANDVAFLVRSLGGVAKVKIYTQAGKSAEYRVVVQTEFNPFTTKFKRERWQPVSHKSAKMCRSIASLKASRICDQICIKVSAEDGLYLTDDLIVTHNTGAAIMACDAIRARRILVITTATNRLNFAAAFKDWSDTKLPTHVLLPGAPLNIGVGDKLVIVGWPALADAKIMHVLRSHHWDVLLVDEAHYASNVLAGGVGDPVKRTLALYGMHGLIHKADRVWLLTGTPIPKSPDNLYPMLRGLWPKRLQPYDKYEDFVEKFCEFEDRWGGGRMRRSIKGGLNLDLIRRMLDGIMLCRTQADVGIVEPVYDMLLLDTAQVDGRLRETLSVLGFASDAILEAAEAGATNQLDMQLATLRRETGAIKAHLVAEAAKERFASGSLKKLVLMSWHRETMDVLDEALSRVASVYRLDGSTPARKRQEVEQGFGRTQRAIFNGQMQAAGEAIDLSSADELWFVEPSWSPKDMKQAALRITNHTAAGLRVVRVAALAGSIDEAVNRILMRRVATIKTIMEK